MRSKVISKSLLQLVFVTLLYGMILHHFTPVVATGVKSCLI